MKQLLDNINSPLDIKNLSIEALPTLSKEVNKYIREIIEELGGHYSSPLGVIDLTIALHYIYNSPNDKIIWDVGHQAYAHKILTGRRKQFKNIRSKEGISGFLKRNESQHDIFGAGHASTSISAALGFAHGRDRDHSDNQVVAIIGDGAMTGGLAYEGINNLGFHKTQLTIILNDNSHSISKSVGALSHYLTKIVTNSTYNRIRNDIWKISGKLPMSTYVRKILQKTELGIKGYITPGALFEELGLRYIGPIDGHNIGDMIHTFKAVKKMNTPVLIHVYTQKGKGSEIAEQDAIKYYSLGGKINKNNALLAPDYSKVFGESITQLAENDDKIICVTAAMQIGTGMTSFIKRFPKKYIDVGISEGHAVTYSAGLSAAGYKPIVPIYSTFMQRSFDQIFHDALLQDLPIIFCMDRSGLVGPDGPTHHGVFDIAFMRLLPEMIISAPKDGNELRNLLATALKSAKNFSIRYPKDCSRLFTPDIKPEYLKLGSWEIIHKGTSDVILAVGSMVGMVEDNKELIYKKLGYLPTIINARFIKPLHKELLLELCLTHEHIITIEEGALAGGFGSAIGEFLHDNNLTNQLTRLGIPDHFIGHGTRIELLEEVGLTVENLILIINKKDKKKVLYEQ